MNRLGIMGGTFDPIHFGHLVAAEMARCKFQLNKVLFIPSGNPPHKGRGDIAPAKVRMEMVAHAVRDNQAFGVSTIELERKGPSYTVDTLRALQRIYPGCGLYFITGTDALLQIFSWREPEEILKMTEFIGVARPDYDASDFFLKLTQEHSEDRGRIHYLEVPALAISSTDIRQRVHNGETVRYLLPESVRKIILNKKLYLD